MNNIYFGDQKISTHANSVILDSGSSYLVMPKSDKIQFEKIVKSNFSCSHDIFYRNMFYCNCLFSKGIKDFP